MESYKDEFDCKKGITDLLMTLDGIIGVAGIVKNIPKIINKGLKVAGIAKNTLKLEEVFGISRMSEIELAGNSGINSIGKTSKALEDILNTSKVGEGIGEAEKLIDVEKTIENVTNEGNNIAEEVSKASKVADEVETSKINKGEVSKGAADADIHNYENQSHYSTSKWSDFLNDKYGKESVNHDPNIKFKEDYYVEHTTGPITKFTERNGTSGGHNYDELKNYFNDKSNKYKLVEIGRNNHPEIDGIFDIEYRVKYEKMDYTGKRGTGSYKEIPPEGKKPFMKTVYDPKK
ncbi:hypothetical protein [Clostridium taeniosporum]|uniref:hypothetical protein n=1 Tax=Clostridium taeniosporum TaxID=394958 RepID=UPI00084E3193|nr:hypothetical protein [Clostridium taeniosporum]